MKPIATLFAILLLALPSCAATETQALYLAGKYDAAMRLGGASKDAADLVAAARAALADATTRSQPCADCLERAQNYAQAAVAADPRLPTAHVLVAITLGQQARLRGPVLARLHKDPARAKAELDKALALDPHNALALASLGAWNVEIVRVGGPDLARWLYGASLEAGLKDFSEAFRAAPANVTLYYQYALSLAGYDPTAYRTAIMDALDRAVTDTPLTAYEKVAQKRSAVLLALLKRGDAKTFAARVHKYQGYPQ
jgi:hypothetical protein